MEINYQDLLNTANQALISAPVDEMDHYGNMISNICELMRKKVVRDTQCRIKQFALDKCQEWQCNELETSMVLTRYDYYLNSQYLKEDALRCALIDIFGRFN